MKHIVLFLIKVYQRIVSPILPPSCRFYPSCSEYACEALEKYGFARGVFMSLRRLFRCHPFGTGGFDPVK